ncbi:MAG TPA: hypothetical protein VJS11_11850, partial [Acidobacteriaceae bacterium]|nr:hypothetical protein [Acidobacteriaceae bacterium]
RDYMGHFPIFAVSVDNGPDARCLLFARGLFLHFFLFVMVIVVDKYSHTIDRRRTSPAKSVRPNETFQKMNSPLTSAREQDLLDGFGADS